MPFVHPSCQTLGPVQVPTNRSTAAVRCAARALARNAGCRRRLEHLRACSMSEPKSAWAVRPSAASARSHRLERDKYEVPRTARSLRACRTMSSQSLLGRKRRRPRAVVQPRTSRPVQAYCAQLAPPALVCFSMQKQGKVAFHRAWPNPSIEGTLSGLRPPSAPHVKR
jgi:hypothetical protein